MRCVIMGAGDFCENITFKANDLIIAADGGLRHLEGIGVKPEFVIGDFDSLGYVPSDLKVIQKPVEKDETDMSLAMREGIERGAQEFHIYGAFGGERIDHTIANIQIMAELAKQGIKAIFYNGKQKLYAICNKNLEFFCGDGYVSIFSLSDKSEGVTVKNLKYELNNASLSNTFPLGVSNQGIGENAFVEVKSGILLIIESEK